MTSVGIIFLLIYIVFIIAMLVLWVYGFILFVKLARRGIKALDIFIYEKTNKEL